MDPEILKYQEYLILTLYKNFPLRNDFASMEVISQREYNKISKENKKNYLVVRTNNKPMYRSILNSYKTSAKYNQKIIEVKDSELEKVIKKYLEHQRSKYFTISPVGTLGERALTSNELTKIFGAVSTREIGKRLGSSLLRHIVIYTPRGQGTKLA